jgi:hypothetical protein
MSKHCDTKAMALVPCNSINSYNLSGCFYLKRLTTLLVVALWIKRGGKGNKFMGMTDKQFNGFVRFLLDALKEAKDEKEPEKREQKLEKVIENLQTTLED